MKELKLIETDQSNIAMSVWFENLTPNQLFNAFTQEDGLVRWWAQEAETDPRAGGDYHLSWPAIGKDLRGKYVQFAPGKRLAFTWQWDDEPGLPERLVTIEISAQTAGCHLHLTQGTYGDSKTEAVDRQNHIDGWLYFLEELGKIRWIVD